MGERTAATWRHRLGLLKSECIYRWFPGRTRAMRSFYRGFLSPGDLCFDLGSHVGVRAHVLSTLGCSVVALEPHPYLGEYLRSRFAGNSHVIVDQRGVSDAQGEATLYSSPRFLSVSSLKSGWLDSLQDVRAHNIEFTESCTVETTTIGALFEQYGIPRYCKIDIEGLDLAVIRSMPVPVDIVSFEHLPNCFDATAASLDALNAMAEYRFNFFTRESHRFRMEAAAPAERLMRALTEIAESGWSCDVFAFRTP